MAAHPTPHIISRIVFILVFVFLFFHLFLFVFSLFLSFYHYVSPLFSLFCLALVCTRKKRKKEEKNFVVLYFYCGAFRWGCATLFAGCVIEKWSGDVNYVRIPKTHLSS